MISVLRIGHRSNRDKRITTHVALVARAFGADEVIVDTRDRKMERTINSVCKRFGGDFRISTGVDKKKIIKNWEGTIVHLTMYGETLEKTLKEIDKKRDLLVIVGAEKVPFYIYELSDYNISIGNQPHSEVSALAIFLDRYTDALWQRKKFDGEIKIVPCGNAKKVVSKKGDH